MNYAAHYQALISRAEGRVLEGYSERHHVVPKCLDRASKRTVRLTAAEHYVCHQLLCKMHPDNKKLVFAAWRMTQGTHRNNKRYTWLRRKHADAMRAQNTGIAQSAEHVAKRVAAVAGRTCSGETKERMRVAQKASHLKFPCSAETRKRQSDSHKGVLLTAECKVNMSLAHLGHDVSDATREKMRLAALGNTRAKRSAADALLSPELKLRQRIMRLNKRIADLQARMPRKSEAV